MENKILGLTTQEAERRRQNGTNELRSQRKVSFWDKVKDEAKDEAMKILFFLIFAEGVNFVVGRFWLGLENDFYSLIMICSIVAIVIFSGAWRNYKQDKGSINLKSAEKIAKVYRDGKLCEMSINNIVCGDCVLLEAGDEIPADGFLIQGSVKANQSKINGRAHEEVEKVALGNNTISDENDLFGKYKCFRKSIVKAGTAVMEVTAVGKDTLVGKRSIIKKNERLTPAAEKTKRLFKFITIFGYSSAVIVAVRSLILGYLEMGSNDISIAMTFYVLLNAIMMGVAIIVMAIPEGLPLIGSMIQSMNVKAMKADNIYVRNSKSIETAGYVSRFFTNKTAILTNGNMSVVNVIIGTGYKYEKFEELSGVLKTMIELGVGVNNEAVIGANGRAIGSNSTDRALLNYLVLENKRKIDKSLVKSSEAFDSLAKLTTITLHSGTKYIKGAADIVMDGCINYIDEEGLLRPFNDGTRERLAKVLQEQKEEAMRVIAVVKSFEGEKTFVALISIRDDAKENAKPAIERMGKAGIKITMATGDDLETAKAIGRKIGLITKSTDICISHDDLIKMSDEEVIKALPNLKVVARVEAKDKERLIKLSQSIGEVVGMTVNNVNDVSVCNHADISFAIMSTTELAKQASDVIILDDNLATIAETVKYGRSMTKTIKKFILFQLTVNVSAVLIAILGPFFGSSEVFTIVQMLWINMVMDVLAAIAFAQERPLEAYMIEKPIPKTEDLLSINVKTAVMVCGIFITVVCLGILTNIGGIHSMISSEEIVVKTFMFAIFVFMIIMNAFNARTESLNLLKDITKNKKFILVMSSIAVIQIMIIQFGEKIFGTVPLTFYQWGNVILIAMIIWPLDIIRKKVVRIIKKGGKF